MAKSQTPKKYRLLLTQEAKNDIKEAKSYYKKQQKGLEKRFLQAIKDKLVLLQKQPFSAQVRLEKEGESIRGAVLDSFPFLIYYLPDETVKTILILAVLHTKQNQQDFFE
jgi:plasmid stabilization system protein ParE